MTPHGMMIYNVLLLSKLTIAELNSLFPKMHFNSLLGIRVVRTHPDGVTIECAVRDDLRNFAGVLHGGVTATMADAAAGIGLQRHFGGKQALTTVELKVNYLRAVTDGEMRARSYILRAGSTLCVCRVDMFDDQKRLAATAIVTYMLLR